MPSNQLQEQISRLMAAKSCDYVGAISPNSLPNSVMPPEVAKQFIDETVDLSVLVKRVRVLKVDACSGRIPKLNLIGPVTHGASAKSCPTSTPLDEKTLFYELVKYRSYFEIETDFINCNIEKEAVVNTVENMFKNGIANDSETAAISGDSGLTIGDDASDINNLLGVNDGWMKKLCACLPECNILDAAGASPSAALYFQAKNRIPMKFRKLQNQYRWIASPDVSDHWAYYWTGRDTSGGDSALATGDAPGPLGVKFLPVPLFPNCIPYGSTGDPVSHILLTPPENLIYIIGRQLKMERVREAKCDLDYFVMHWSADYLVEDPNKVVIIKNVNLCGSAYTGCEPCCAGDDVDSCG